MKIESSDTGRKKTIHDNAGHLEGHTKSYDHKHQKSKEHVHHDNVGGFRFSSWASQKSHPRNSTGIRGVNQLKDGRYSARLKFKGQTVLQRKFKTIEEAIKARQEAWEKYVKPYLDEYSSDAEEKQNEEKGRRRQQPKPIQIGDQFNYWTVIGLNGGLPEHKGKVLYRCICGKVRWRYRQFLRDGRSKSCGCKKWVAYRPPDYGIYPGDKVGYWTILRQDHHTFFCRCLCGTERQIPGYRLVKGQSRSCGCQQNQERKLESIKAALEKGKDLMAKLDQSNLTAKYPGFGHPPNSRNTSGTGSLPYSRQGCFAAKEPENPRIPFYHIQFPQKKRVWIKCFRIFSHPLRSHRHLTGFVKSKKEGVVKCFCILLRLLYTNSRGLGYMKLGKEVSGKTNVTLHESACRD